ncbi:B3 domain-containing transcription factor VRN1-like [Arachis duranensis]|uniref:B3 domain-containing transcription factor VRN1-like n=1 Tax=Arachis duranensis TaxID=130453 RepID=A0A6P5MY12_ARADU|nr:B3 domain-containing transcription factor VRN1-like [Arachis duranensis]QHO36239.1 B3 domain-containing transcription factor [Arachis hypogaea]
MSSSSQWRGKAIIPVHFSAIIFNKTDLQTLKISSKFTRRYGGGLSNPLFLKPPDGTKWEVNWTRKDDEEVWFQKGWNKFTENYSLDHGHLILFTYHGNSQLDVHIFDKSASEILYPGLKLNTTTTTTACDDEKNIKLDLMHNDDDSIEILKPCKHKRSMLVLVPQPCNKRMKDEKKKVAERRSSCSSLNWPKQERAQEVAMNFVSDNPFFTMFITHVHLAHYKAAVPNFEEYIIDEEEKNVELKIGEKSWEVKLRRCSKSSNYRYFGGGWSLFAQESELLPGDVCVFELINMHPLQFRVHVFKKRQT